MANYLLTQTGEEVQVILNQAPETEAGLQQEVTNREQAITAEQQAREQAIAAEATAREQAIAAEATAREQAVSAEATVRADADDALDTKIDAETTRAVAAEGTLTDAINKEVTDRTAAVAAEATARQQADTTLQQAISTEAQARSTADTEILGNLQTEARTRLNADTDLQEHIDDEEERAKAAEATLQANIDTLGQSGGAAVAAERERAEAAEGMLDAKIDAETDRAEAAEGTLNAAIAQEVTDRTAAVSAEATARADADAALQTAINGKQATIADLADIRSGAAAGATAYQKPATGIPATDMSSDVQTSLDKADTALQEHQSLDDYYTKSEVDNLITTPDQEYVSVTATAQTTAVTDLLPSTGAADTLYRVGNWDGTQYDPTMYALFAWNGTTYVCLAVRSFVGEVYDVSVNHPDGQGNPTPYADLTAALGTDGANIPVDIRRGGMSIKFIQGTVQSSDNKYVQYRLLNDEWSTDTNLWSLCNEDVLIENPEWVRVVTDNQGKILYGVKTDGKFYFGDGCPPQVVEYITAQLEELGGDFTTLLNTKVDKVIGKSLIDSEFASSQEVITNPEYLQVTTDSEGKILEAIKTDGTKVIGGDAQIGGNTTISGDATILGKVDIQGATYTLQENPEWIKVLTDAQDRIIAGVRKDGSVYINKIDGVASEEAVKALQEADTALDERVTALESGDNPSINGFSKILSYTNYASKKIDSSNQIGNTLILSDVATGSRTVIEVSVEDLIGNIEITNVLSQDNMGVAVVDSNNVVLDLLNNSNSNGHVQKIIVDLSKYTSANKIYADRGPVGYSGYDAPVVTNYMNGLSNDIKTLHKISSNKGVLLLHCDAIIDRTRLNIFKEYGINVSWCLNKQTFNDDNTFASDWSDGYKELYEEAVKRGDDFGLYPSMNAAAMNESQWNDWINTALTNLSQKGIHNITAFACGQLAINDDLYNAVKASGFKIIRGGTDYSVSSINTYPYTDENRWLPLNVTEDTYFVAHALELSNNQDMDDIQYRVNYAINSNSATPIFLHGVPNALSEANLRNFLDFVTAKIAAGKLKCMTWRQFYRSINQNDGYEWDYNRIIKTINV